MRFCFVCSVLPLLSLVPAPAQSPPPPPPAPVPLAAAQVPGGAPLPLTLEQALDFARTHNPTVLAAAGHVAAVRANEITAGLRTNPQFTVNATQSTLSNDDSNGPNFSGFGLQRVFELGHKRDRRLDAARANTAVAAAGVDDLRRGLDLAVRTAFARMLLARLALAVSEENLLGYRHTVELMQFRLQAGDVDRTDFERVELQLAGFENDATNARLALTQASQQLQFQLGYPAEVAGFDIVGTLEPPALSQSRAELEQAALSSRPDLLQAQRQVEANDAAIRLADALVKPDPLLGAEYERSGYANTAGFNLTLPLRLLDKGQGERARTRAEAGSSRLALLAQRNQVVAEVDQAYAALVAAREQTDRYRSKYLAEAAHVRDNLEFSYRNGNTTLLDYLSALSDYRQVNLAALNAQAQLQLALDQLRYVSATEVTP